MAQNSVSPLQNGTPLAPTVTGTDSTAGIYFGPNRTGVSGHAEAGAGAGDVPTISACGGTVAPVAGSTDFAGTVTNGGTVTTCTINFGTAYSVAPSCVVSDITGTRASMSSLASGTALVVTGITAADSLAWICVAHSGG
jgi:hypothetical protein